MPVLHDYECMAHGTYEATEPKCPYGCSKAFQKLVFLKPVGTRSNKTRFVDAELRAQAKQYGLTNLATQRDGESVMTSMRRTGNYGEAAQARWLQDVPHEKPGWSWGKDPLKAQAEAQRLDVKAMSNGEVQPVFTDAARQTLPPVRPQLVAPPMPVR